jgi:hypothetical protein
MGQWTGRPAGADPELPKGSPDEAQTRALVAEGREGAANAMAKRPARSSAVLSGSAALAPGVSAAVQPGARNVNIVVDRQIP